MAQTAESTGCLLMVAQSKAYQSKVFRWKVATENPWKDDPSMVGMVSTAMVVKGMGTGMDGSSMGNARQTDEILHRHLLHALAVLRVLRTGEEAPASGSKLHS